MAAPAGPCEWCGGPQSWTIISDAMYVRCVGGCQGLFGEAAPTHLLDSEGYPKPPQGSGVEHEGKEAGRALVGGAAEEMDRSQEEVTEPPVGWLSTLWEGGWDG